MVFADVDGIIRTIPLKWERVLQDTPLSVRIAQCMKSKCGEHDLVLPQSKLLRFVPTNPGGSIIGESESETLLSSSQDLKGKFLLVGEHSPTDTFATPLNEETPGTMIHAFAVTSLLAPHYITRPPAWFSAFIVIAACCILALLASQNAKPRTLLIVAAVLSVAVCALAATAMVLFLVWLDIIYVIVAVWLLLPLLIGYQRMAVKNGGGVN